MRTGLRWWVIFCRVLSLHYFLFEHSDLPLSYEMKAQVEYKLLLFIAFLGRVRKPKVLKGRVMMGYVGHVKTMHAKVAMGRAFKDVVDATGRLQTISKVMQSWRPSDERMKVAFSVAHFEVFSRCVDELKKNVTIDVRFLLDRVRMAVAVMLTGVLRSSEICDNKDCAAANRAPIWLSDLRFMRSATGGDDVSLEPSEDGKAPVGAEYIQSRMPPRPSQTLCSEWATSCTSQASFQKPASKAPKSASKTSSTTTQCQPTCTRSARSSAPRAKERPRR